MRKISILLLALIAYMMCLMATSCHPKITESLSTKDVQKSDSLYVKKDSTYYRDTTLKVKGSVITIQNEVKADTSGCINMPETVIETEHSKANASIINGKLLVNCVCKDLELRVKLQERLIREYAALSKLKQAEKTIYKTMEVRYIPKGVKLLAWVGGASLVFYILLVIYSCLKFFKVIQKP